MAKKNVYAAIEIADREIRLVVLEVFDSRNNILRVERVPHSGLKESAIVDSQEISQAIEQAVRQAQTALGYHIERVLLAIPARNVATSHQNVHVEIEDGTHTVRLFHIQQGLKTAMQKKMSEDQELINPDRISYSIQGVAQSKIPLGADTTQFDMDVDLLYGDKELLYSYARAVEGAGLQILDICLDAYAQSKETAALEQSADRPIILVSLEADHTVLTYLDNGRLLSSMTLDEGYRSFVEELCRKENLSDATGWRLLENLFDSKEMDSSDVILYIEQQEDRRVEITAKELAKAVLPKIRSWIAEINAACQPILSSRPGRYVITGQGSDIPVLKSLDSAFSAPASVYSVTDIGARSGAYATALGLSYAWEEMNRIRHEDKTSVNNNELEASIDSISRYEKEGIGGFTKKLKKVMLQN